MHLRVARCGKAGAGTSLSPVIEILISRLYKMCTFIIEKNFTGLIAQARSEGRVQHHVSQYFP